jgi:signal transduction histidine kinase
MSLSCNPWRALGSVCPSPIGKQLTHDRPRCYAVTDDGKGFEVQQVLFCKGQRRLGVLGRRERVHMLGGQYSLESAPGKGATVRVRIPLRGGGARGERNAADSLTEVRLWSRPA